MDPTSLRQLDIGFPVPEVNALALPERKVFKPIYQMGKWFARRSSAVFRALLLAAALPAEPPDDFKACIRAMLKERRGSGQPEPTDEEVDKESRRLYLMAMFYRNNQENPYTKDLIVLDPFMGGGTTIVEAARLGMKPIGVDVNPVAWFITKTELEPVSISLLKDAFEQLRHRPVILSDPPPSGVPKTLEAFIKHWYTTRCPSCGGDAELIYALWVKRHRCLNPLCDSPVVRFFKNYLVTQKDLRVSYIEDCICPVCSTPEEAKTFDWELEPTSLLFLPGLANQISVPGLDAGTNRKTHGGGHKIRWASAPWPGPVTCPHCRKDVVPTHRFIVEETKRADGKETRVYSRERIATPTGQAIVNGKTLDKRGRLTGREIAKVVPITVFYNPKDQALWEYRGLLPTDDTTRPWYEKAKARPTSGATEDTERKPRPFVPVPGGTKLFLDEGPECGGDYICSGNQQHVSAVFDAGSRRLAENSRPTPFEMDCYAIEGYCPRCAAAGKGVQVAAPGPDLFNPAGTTPGQAAATPTHVHDGSGLPMSAANNLFFKTPDPADIRRIEQAEAMWEQLNNRLVWPKGHAIPYGYNTRVGNDLWVHGYHDWSDVFTRRQLLAYGQLALAIATLPEWYSSSSGNCVQADGENIVDVFCDVLMTTLNNNSILCWYDVTNHKTSRVFAQHHFQPKVMVCEGSVWGGHLGQGSFVKGVAVHLEALRFRAAPFDGLDERTQEFSIVPSLGQANTLVRPWIVRTPAEQRELDDAIEQLCAGPSLRSENNGVYQRTAIHQSTWRALPWDGLSTIHLQQLRGRSDLLNLQSEGGRSAGLACCDSRELRFLPDASVDVVITDPPFGDNVNYSELSDFFYVWLAPILKGRYADARGNDLFDHWEDEILPKDRAERDRIGFTEDPSLPDGFVRRRSLLQTPKRNEIIESRASQQTKTARDYNDALRAAFAEAHRKLKPQGLMAFTFHHNDVRAWWAVIAAVLECVPPEAGGFHLEAVYPIIGEAETTTHHHEKQNATFDIIHVCRKRTVPPTPVKWAVFRRKVREAVRRKREELLAIPAFNLQEGGYVSRADLRMILLGVGFQLYSEHYGRVEFPLGFVAQAQAAPRGRRGKQTIADAAQMLFESDRQVVRRESDPSDDPTARNLREIAYAIDEILDELEHEQANPLPPELESLAGEVDRISRYYFKNLLPEHGRTIKYDDLKQLEYRTGVSVSDLMEVDVLTTRSKGRVYEIKRPCERYRRLRERFLAGRPPLSVLDRSHFLIGAIDDAGWAGRARVESKPIDQFLVDGQPVDVAWADEKDQLSAAIRMIAAHVEEEETRAACVRTMKWLVPGLELFEAPPAPSAVSGENG